MFLYAHAQVLRWYGFYKEAVNESAQENYRVRKVVVLYYLEDDSCQVVEPREDNSGLPQVGFNASVCMTDQPLGPWPIDQTPVVCLTLLILVSLLWHYVLPVTAYSCVQGERTSGLPLGVLSWGKQYLCLHGCVFWCQGSSAGSRVMHLPCFWRWLA